MMHFVRNGCSLEDDYFISYCQCELILVNSHFFSFTYIGNHEDIFCAQSEAYYIPGKYKYKFRNVEGSGLKAFIAAAWR